MYSLKCLKIDFCYLTDNEQNIPITSFLFDGLLYKANASISAENVVTRLWGFGKKLDNGGWLFQDPTVAIKKDQRIYYHVYVSTGYGQVGEKNSDGIANLTLPVYESMRRFYVVNCKYLMYLLIYNWYVIAFTFIQQSELDLIPFFRLKTEMIHQLAILICNVGCWKNGRQI